MKGYRGFDISKLNLVWKIWSFYWIQTSLNFAIDITYICIHNLLFNIWKIHRKIFSGLINIWYRAKFIYSYKMDTNQYLKMLLPIHNLWYSFRCSTKPQIFSIDQNALVYTNKNMKRTLHSYQLFFSSIYILLKSNLLIVYLFHWGFTFT